MNDRVSDRMSDRMSDKEFFKELGQQWQEEKSQPELSVEKALSAQRLIKVKHYFHVATTILILMIACYFLSLPFSVILVAAGFFLIVAVVVDWHYLIRFRRPITNWADWSSAGLLEYHESLLKAEITSAKYFIFSSVALLVFTGFLWGLAFFDQEFQATGFHYVFSVISIPIALVFISYYGYKLKSSKPKKEALNRLAREQEAY